MAAVLKVDREAVEAALEGLQGVWIANLNAPGQTVISGYREAVEEAARTLKAKRARVVFLKVSAPFHSPLMQPAAEKLAAAIEETAFNDPAFPVYANVSAEPVTDAQTAKALLIEQVTAPVRWVDILTRLGADGFRTFLEFGSGNVLTGLLKRTLPEARARSIEGPDELADTV